MSNFCSDQTPGERRAEQKGPFLNDTRSHLKNRILVQGQGGAEVQSAGILQYSEELKRGPNAEIGPKDFFEMASN